jgi:hypothetical protein
VATAGTSNFSKKIYSIFIRCFIGLEGTSVSKTGFFLGETFNIE